MAKKTSRKRPGQMKLSPVAQRVADLVDALCDGNQRAFAALVGCSQAVISKVLNGQQQPGKKLLQLIAALPKVNPLWLREGKGAPLLARVRPSDEEGWQIPVAVALLPGPPADHPDLLSSRLEYVPGILHRDTVYAVEAAQCAPASLHTEEKMLLTDLIVIDADTKRWRRNIQLLNGKLCAVSCQSSAGSRIELRRTTDHSNSADDSKSDRDSEDAVKVFGKPLRSIPLDPHNSDDVPEEIVHECVSIEDIVGIALQLIRPL